MAINLTVITCTHNPRREYLDKVLRSLMAQTLPLDQWEYLLIDNKSDQGLATEIDLSWHPHARHIREEELGLTPARLRGIREAAAEVLVFVDDDNALNDSYLEHALRISNEYPFIGAWGGEITGDFEITPPEWTKPYWPYLGIRELSKDSWSNLVNQYETAPCGAGICLRKNVAQVYAKLIREDKKRLTLGRSGQALLSCEDSDLAFTACDQGMGTGLFTSLKLRHLIPAKRLEESYLLKLIEGIEYSRILMESIRETPKLPSSLTWKGKLLENLRLLKSSERSRKFYLAKKRGRERAIKALNI